MPAPRGVVIGGGLAGLVAAHVLRERGLEVRVLEAAAWPGGKVRTDREEGYLLEWGPQSFMWETDGALARAVVRAGLEERVTDPAPGAKKRYVLRGGRPYRVPSQVWGLLSAGGVLRAMVEPCVAARRGGGPESLSAFARRRFGAEAADVLFDALVSGVFAGDPARLEVHTAFARMWELEQQYGSLVWAGVTGGFKPRPLRGLQGGLGSLPEGLAARLGDAVRLETPAEALAREGEGWRVTAGGEEHTADALLIAAPSYAAAGLLRSLDPALADLLDEIPYAGLAAVSLGYDAGAFPAGPPDGFGCLVPRSEGLTTLGCLFASSAFPAVAPQGKVLLRAMLGGRRAPEVLDMDDEALVARARADVEPLTGAEQAPELVRVARHARAIPQYELGHGERVARIEAALQRWPGLHLTGNPYRGVSLGDVALDAERVAAAAAERLVGAPAAPA